jgi:predicted  nucleic acid-binding Zn-ribbon protein
MTTKIIVEPDEYFELIDRVKQLEGQVHALTKSYKNLDQLVEDLQDEVFGEEEEISEDVPKMFKPNNIIAPPPRDHPIWLRKDDIIKK